MEPGLTMWAYGNLSKEPTASSISPRNISAAEGLRRGNANMTIYRVRLGLHDTAVRVERHRLTAICIVYSDGPSALLQEKNTAAGITIMAVISASSTVSANTS